jgi:hypothetical protein
MILEYKRREEIRMTYFDDGPTQDIERAKTLSKQNGAAILVQGRVHVDVSDLQKAEPNAHPSVLVARMCSDLFPRSSDEGVDDRIISGTDFIVTGPVVDDVRYGYEHLTRALVDGTGRASGTVTLLIDGREEGLHQIAA